MDPTIVDHGMFRGATHGKNMYHGIDHDPIHGFMVYTVVYSMTSST